MSNSSQRFLRLTQGHTAESESDLCADSKSSVSVDTGSEADCPECLPAQESLCITQGPHRKKTAHSNMVVWRKFNENNMYS